MGTNELLGGIPRAQPDLSGLKNFKDSQGNLLIPDRPLTNRELGRLKDTVAPEGIQPFDGDYEISSILFKAPTEATEGDLNKIATVRAKYKNKALREAPRGPESTSKVPGFIIQDAREQVLDRRKLQKEPKESLIEIAKTEGVPDIKEITPRVTNEQLIDSIQRNRLKYPYDRPEEIPKVNTREYSAKDLKRVPDEQVLIGTSQGVQADTTVNPLETHKDFLSKVDQGVSKIFGDPKEIAKKPFKVNQVLNYVNTVRKYSDVLGHPNIPNELLEYWHYYSQEVLTDTDRATLERQKKPLVEALSENTGINDTGSLERMMDTQEGFNEIVGSLFEELAQRDRTRRKVPLKGVPNDSLRILNKGLNSLKKSQATYKGLGKDRETMVDPQVLNDSLDALRKTRLERISEEIQRSHWAELADTNYKELGDEAISKELHNTQKMGLYSRFISSMSHLASVNPLAGVAFNIQRAQDDMQSELLTKYRDIGHDYFSEGSKEIRTKAAEVLDHLRNTGQDLTIDPNTGFIVFQRGDQTVELKDPRMTRVVKGLDNTLRAVLDDGATSIRVEMNKVLPGSLTAPVDIIEESTDRANEDQSIPQEDITFMYEQIDVLKNIENMKRSGFVPHSRQGGYGFTVHLKENIDPKTGKVKPGVDPVFHAQVEDGKHKGKFDKFQYQMVQKDLQQFKGDPRYKVSEGYLMTYDNIFNRLGEDQITFDLLAALLGSDKSEDAYVNIKENLDRKVKSKGFARRFSEAKNIPGYSKDWDRVLNSYFTGAAHYFAKQRYRPELESFNRQVQTELGNVERHQPIQKKINDYTDYMSSPNESFQNIRAINFLWTMGGNLSTALLQYLTLPTTSLGSMTRFNPNPVNNMRYLQRYFNMALKNSVIGSSLEGGSVIFRYDDPRVLKKLLDTKQITPDEASFIRKAVSRGRTGAAFLEEQAGTKRYDTRSRTGGVKDKLGSITNAAGIPISAMEQATRFATLMAHYRMLKDNPKALKAASDTLQNDFRFQTQRKLSGNTLAEDVAFFGADEAHAVFGKTGRSDIMRGGLGAFVFPFQTYPQQVVEFIVRMASSQGGNGKRGALATLGSLFLMSGLMGLPGGELLKELLEEAYKAYEGEEVDLDYEIRRKLTETTGDPTAGLFLTQGAGRAFFNVDVARRVGLPIIGQDILLAAMGVRGDVPSELTGVQGSMLANGIEAWRSYNQDESGSKVVSLLTPTAISNILKAHTYAEEGVQTKKGTQLISPEDTSSGSIYLRAMGFTSGEIASAREAQYWVQLENTRVRPKMNSFRAKGKNLVTKRYRALKQGNLEESERYVREYKQLTKEVEDFLKKKDFVYDMRSFHRSVMDAVDQRILGSVRLEDLAKGARKEFKTLKRTAGVE
jgi:hypothetical protein